MKRSVLTVSVSLLVCFTHMQDAHAINRNADFDGDGIDDLAIGVPSETPGSITAAGVVNILYGSASSLTDPATRSTTIWQDLVVGSDAAEGAAQANDRFGGAITWGDFNGDCFDDLAVGIPGENSSAGFVQVFYGSSSGLSMFNDELWDRSGTIKEAPDAGDAFGDAVAAGDFNGDGFDDLAIGVPGDEVASDGTNSGGGSVHIIYGSSTGLEETAGPDDQFFYLGSPDIEGDPVATDNFGSTLATGDFDCNGIDDLAIGNWISDSGIGSVNVIYGTSSGLSALGGPLGNQLWSQDSPSIEGDPEVDDFFGWSLAVGNFNGDTDDGFACHDLAIGAVGETINGNGGAGAVNVLYGNSASGLTSTGNTVWYQDLAILDDSEASDDFGWSLVAGRLDNDGFDDLAIGVPGENSDAGAVAIIRGASSGLVSTNNALWVQGANNIPDGAEAGDRFGSALSFGREWNTSVDRALAVGASGENTTAGVVNIVYLQNTATPTPALLGNQLWNQGSIDIQVSESGDRFGAVFAAPRDRAFGVCN